MFLLRKKMVWLFFFFSPVCGFNGNGLRWGIPSTASAFPVARGGHLYMGQGGDGHRVESWSDGRQLVVQRDIQAAQDIGIAGRHEDLFPASDQECGMSPRLLWLRAPSHSL